MSMLKNYIEFLDKHDPLVPDTMILEGIFERMAVQNLDVFISALKFELNKTDKSIKLILNSNSSASANATLSECLSAVIQLIQTEFSHRFTGYSFSWLDFLSITDDKSVVYSLKKEDVYDYLKAESEDERSSILDVNRETPQNLGRLVITSIDHHDKLLNAPGIKTPTPDVATIDKLIMKHTSLSMDWDLLTDDSLVSGDYSMETLINSFVELNFNEEVHDAICFKTKHPPVNELATVGKRDRLFSIIRDGLEEKGYTVMVSIEN